MNKKTMPSWLWGGAIGNMVATLIYTFSLFGLDIIKSSLLNPYPDIPQIIKLFSVKMFTFFSTLPFGFGSGGVYNATKFLILLVICFSFGAFIGLQVEKNRDSRKA